MRQRSDSALGFEIRMSSQRYTLISRKRLRTLFGIDDSDSLSEVYRGWVEDALKRDENSREAKWTQSIAVGDKNKRDVPFQMFISERIGYWTASLQAISKKTK